MMRVCTELSSGRLIEHQSGDDPKKLGTLRRNAVAAGWREDEIECRIVDQEEFERLLKASEVEPDDDQVYERTMGTNPVVRGLVQAINDGTMVPGAKVSEETLRAAIVPKMRPKQARR